MHILLYMVDHNPDIVLLMKMTGHALGTVDRTMLAAGASETHHQMLEATLDVTLNRCIDKGKSMLQKAVHIILPFKELNHLSVKTCQRLVIIVTTGVVYGAAIKHKSASVARIILDRKSVV